MTSRRALSTAFAVLVALVAAAPAAGADDVRIVSERTLGKRVLELTVSTPAFVTPTRVQVVLPVGYDTDPRRRWPVAYYYAGLNHDEASFTAQYDGERLTRDLPAIVVASKNDTGYYSDWYNGGAFGAPMYETWNIEQLIPLIDKRFRTTADRSGRVALGESMGGFGVMSYAARHPDVFVAAASLSGNLDTNDGLSATVVSASPVLQGGAPDALYGPRTQQEIRWRGHNPTDLAGNLRDVDLQVRTGDGTVSLADPGISDPGYVAGCVLEAAVHTTGVTFHRRLIDLGIGHLFKDYGPRCHVVSTFEEEIADALVVFKRVFAHPPPPPAKFTYESIEPRFAVWGWDVQADPGRALEFLQMKDAGASGLTLVGSGRTTVTTPRLFAGLRAVDVDGVPIAPARDGRLRFTVDLGAPHAVQERAGGTGPAVGVSHRTILKPHAVAKITSAVATRRSIRVCARSVGGDVPVATLRITGRVKQAAVPTRRRSLTRTVRCWSMRLGRVKPTRVTITGTDRFGHRVRASRSVAGPAHRLVPAPDAVSGYMSDRKVILKMVMSLDGFVTSPDSSHEWMFEFFGDDSSRRSLEAIEEAGVHAMGRHSYEIMGPHWAASDGPIASGMNEKPKAVFSRTLEQTTWGPAEIFDDVATGIADLKARDDDGTVLVHGGPTLARSLTRLGLVDEFQLSTVPIAIGAGLSPFADLDEHIKFDIVDEERFRSGALAQTLVPRR